MSDLSHDFSPPQSSVEPGFPTSTSGASGSTGSTGSNGSNGSTTDTAADQAKQVKDQAVDTTKQVAGVAAEQAHSVASEAKAQTLNVVGEARQQLTDQAATQQNNLASWLFTLVDELEHMADRSADAQTSGTATALVRQVSDRAHGAASWLQDHEPQDLLAETGRFARRRPALFLGLALAGGVVAGRLTRGLTADRTDGSGAAQTGATSTGVRSTVTSYPSTPQAAFVPLADDTDPEPYAAIEHPVTYGTGSSLTGSGVDLPAASGYTDDSGRL